MPLSIATLAAGGERRFEIRLDPAELGRIDVNLSIDREGAIRTHIVVERPETIQLLRADAPKLEQALNDAGLKTDPSGINLSLRNGGGQNQTPAGRPDSAPPPAEAGRTVDSTAPAALPYRRLAGVVSRLDLVL